MKVKGRDHLLVKVCVILVLLAGSGAFAKAPPVALKDLGLKIDLNKKPAIPAETVFNSTDQLLVGICRGENYYSASQYEGCMRMQEASRLRFNYHGYQTPQSSSLPVPAIPTVNNFTLPKMSMQL